VAIGTPPSDTSRPVTRALRRPDFESPAARQKTPPRPAHPSHQALGDHAAANSAARRGDPTPWFEAYRPTAILWVMRVDEIRHYHAVRPFRPFTLRVADGREYVVRHPEFLSISMTGRTVVVSTPDDHHEVIDMLMITSVHLGNGRKSKRNRKSP
jgi:hypothetical protein